MTSQQRLGYIAMCALFTGLAIRFGSWPATLTLIVVFLMNWHLLEMSGGAR